MTMKFEKQIEAFILLRIEGKSFDEIATALKTSKQTAIEWNKQLLVKTAITEGQALKINGIVKTFQFNLENRLNTYLKISEKINNELRQRDFTDLNTDTLLKMSIANDDRIKNLLNKNIQIGENKNLFDYSKGEGFFNLQLDE